jgi:hypothetical protein
MLNPSCREIRSELIEGARAGVLAPKLAAHVARCEACARFHEGQSRLSGAFAALAEGLEPAPSRIEAGLLAELNKREAGMRRVSSRRRMSPVAIGAGAIAAALVAGLVFRPHAQPIVATPQPLTADIAPAAPVAAEPPPIPVKPKRRPTPRPIKVVEAAGDINSSPFIELPWTVPLTPNEPASIVRMNLAVSALIAAGFSVNADPAGAAAADVVVGMDGRARAVRLVSISDTVSSNRRMQ